MKILVFGLSSLRGGVESVILNFCTEALEQKLCAFDFVVIDEIPEFARYLTSYGSRFFIVPNRLKNPLGYQRELKKVLQNGSYDLLWYNVCTLSDITLMKLAKKYGVRILLHAHNDENMGNAFTGLLHNYHKRQIASLVDQYAACSKEAAKFMFPNRIVRDNSAWIWVKNAVPLERIRFNADARKAIRNVYGLETACIVGHVGRLHSQKNHRKILSVFSVLHRKRPETMLVLIGGGALEEKIRKDIVARGLSDAVVMIGESDEIDAWLSAFDVFLFPSLYEGLGIALLEAQASGLPCVISETIPLAAICRSNVYRLSLNEDDEVWAAKIEEAMGDSVSDENECKTSDYGSTEHKVREGWIAEREAAIKDVRAAGYDLSTETMKFFGQLSGSC